MIKRKIVNRTIASIASGALDFLKPYAAWAALFVIAIVLFLASHYYDNVQVVVFAVLGCTALLSAFLWQASASRRDFGRVHAVSTMVMIGVWLAAAANFGPWNQWVLFIWFIGGLTLAGTWNIRLNTNAEPRHDPIDQFFIDNGLEGTHAKVLERSKDRIKGVITIARGKNTVEDVQRLKGKMASLFAAPANGVRIEADSDNSSRARFTVVKRDMLAKVVPFCPEDKITSVNDPIRVGVYEDGEPVEFALHSKNLGAIHMLVQGMNGSGKSEFAKVVFARAFKHKNTAIIVIDTAKGNQTLNIARKGIDVIIDEQKIADAMFKRFSKVIKARADELGRLNKSKWDDESGLTFLYFHIEEASGLIADNPAFIKMMETARSVGIAITASLQRASHHSIDTSARAQFSAVMCFGVQDIRDAMFALPDEIVDAGANPAAWRNNKPGYAYLVHPTADDKKWATPLRTEFITDEQLAAAADAKQKVEIDPITMGPLKDLLEANQAIEDDAEEEFIDEETEEQMEMEYEFESQFNDAHLEFDAVDKMSPQEASLVLDERIKEMKEQKIFTFNAPELSDVLIATGLSRAWLHKQLKKRVDEGALTKEDYTYTIVL